MVLNRRELIASALASLPLASCGASLESDTRQILHGDDPLSHESAAGFRALLSMSRSGPKDLVILPAVRAMGGELAQRLRAQVQSGTWVVLESGLGFESDTVQLGQSRIWGAAFGLAATKFITPPELYIEYSLPEGRLIRSFDTVTCVVAWQRDQVMATMAGYPVSLIRRMGRGGVVYLGSMLGPGLAAAEREAYDVGFSILQRIAAGVR